MWRPRALETLPWSIQSSSFGRQLVIRCQIVSLWHQGDTCIDVVDELLEELPSCVHGANWRFGTVAVTAGIAGGR